MKTRLALVKVDNTYQLVSVHKKLDGNFRLCSVIGTGYMVIVESRYLTPCTEGIGIPYYTGPETEHLNRVIEELTNDKEN